MTMFELVIPAFERHLLWSKFQEHVRLYLVRIIHKRKTKPNRNGMFYQIERHNVPRTLYTVSVRVISVYSILW